MLRSDNQTHFTGSAIHYSNRYSVVVDLYSAAIGDKEIRLDMWIIGGAVIIAIVVLPKILELLVGSQRPDYEDLASGDDDKQS